MKYIVLLSLLIVGVSHLFSVTPKIESKKDTYKKFIKSYIEYSISVISEIWKTVFGPIKFTKFCIEYLFSVISKIGKIVFGTIKGIYCKFTECCTENEIPGDYKKLKLLLDEKLFGQPIVKQVVINAIEAHWDQETQAKKPLTLSFHGWPGSGKKYVTRFIKESLYQKAANSDHVHHFDGSITFPLESHVDLYKENLYNWIKSNVTKCPRQLFIFDEVDKIPVGVLNVLKPLLDYNENVDRVDYREAIFIFLSNTGSNLIIQEMLQLWKYGVKREDIKLQNFDKLISNGAFDEEGGFHHSDNIRSNLIDHYVPFLPLERTHIRSCIVEEFQLRNVRPSEEHIKEIFEYVQWGPENEKLFSTTGCKRLSQQVAMIIKMYQLK